MQSSRILRSVTEKGFLLPPRTSIDIFASAADAFLNLMSSEDHRKKFVSSMDKGIIPSVLGEANLSYLRILALHDELDSPLLKEHGFDVNEFLEGVKPALEELHEVQSSLQNKLNEIASSSEEDKEEGDDKDDDVMEVSDGNMFPSMLFPNPETDKIVRRLLKKKHAWKQVAEEDSESHEARLLSMLSPHHFERFEMASKLSFGYAPQFYDLNVQVHNVALLSARGMIIESENETFDVDDAISNEEAQQKVSDNEEEGQSGSRLPAVAAQIEVLYDVEETLVVPVEEGEEEAENKNDDDDKETKTVTRTSVVVGVFEGWLSGGDEEGLRWRVADIRFPFEFPFIAARGHTTL